MKIKIIDRGAPADTRETVVIHLIKEMLEARGAIVHLSTGPDTISIDTTEMEITSEEMGKSA